MIFLTISFFILMMLNFDSENDFFEWVFKTVFSTPFFVVYFCYFVYVFSLYQENKSFSYNKIIKEEKEVIYSLKNSEGLSGSFFLGSGNINSVSKYTYFIKNKDDSKEKKNIDSDGTKIYEDEQKEPYIKIKQCKPGQEFSFLKGWWKLTEPCDFNEIKEIHVPTNTVIMEFKI